MKKITILLLTIFLLISCGKNEKETIVEETGRIVDEYVDTLEGSITDAKAVRDLMDKNNDKLKDNLNNIK